MKTNDVKAIVNNKMFFKVNNNISFKYFTRLAQTDS